MNFVLVGTAKPSSPMALSRVEAASQPRASASPLAPQQSANGSNRRWTQRTGLDRPGYIGGANLTGSVNCIVRNTSRHGALLEVVAGAQSADQLPECFTLVFLVNRIRSEVNCTIKWRKRTQVGVHFVGPIHTSVGSRG